ncbi:M17 family metallopeptidase [Mycoplasma feriruminatoris]|uniref:M17 family metallopeptidase n=3 Tax=Mycoplasma feriruminatoris TaxID=1179777 RepID=UPI001EFA4F3F|nr:M17 family metallopeptidase [Mycoplasma feriruminatoris]UKS54355.1 cytosol aminopeptidase domain protein [Mycoplasma feriruminatoris]
MLKFNDKKEELTLVCLTDVNDKKYVVDADLTTSFISEDKTFYMVIKKDKKDLFRKVKLAFQKFVLENKSNVNIDVDSFFNLLDECDCKKKLINTIYETIAFETYDKVSYKKDAKPNQVVYNLLTSFDVKELEQKEAIKMEFVNFARTLQDTPPNIATSEYLASQIVKKASEIEGLKVTVLGKKQASELGMNLFLAVNAGSPYEPQAVVLEYIGDANEPKKALVGKGITFDSGGYNLKSSKYLEGMKFDMSGAAIMLSTVMALAKNKAKVNVVGIGMFTDNRIGSTATLPQSVVKSMNGLTVEIDDTDAEGRLVLADGITYVIREKQATEVWEASTLTGSVVSALGTYATGVFTHCDKRWEIVKNASKFSGERMWRLPLYEEHLEEVQNDAINADITNATKNYEAESSKAASFLNEFREDKPYVHFDIAGTDSIKGRGQGVLVRTLFEIFNR